MRRQEQYKPVVLVAPHMRNVLTGLLLYFIYTLQVSKLYMRETHVFLLLKSNELQWTMVRITYQSLVWKKCEL